MVPIPHPHRHRFKLVRIVRARMRLMSCGVLGLLLLILLPAHWRQSTRLLIAWDLGISLYLGLTFWMMHHSSLETIRKRCVLMDEGRFAILCLTIVAALASLGAIVVELSSARSAHSRIEIEHVALVVVTVLLSWSFMHTMFTQLYAHEFYKETDQTHHSGLEFPGTPMPDYWDFVYFSFIIGTSAQTADVNIASRMMRRIVTLHCILAFVFNTSILALTVNIVSGLF